MWVRRGGLRWWRDWRPERWVDVGVALEQSTGSDGRSDSIFFVYYAQYDEKKVRSSCAREGISHVCAHVQAYRGSVVFQYLQVFLSEVTALVPLLREGHFAFAVYTPERTRQRGPLILAAHAEQDMSDWVSADSPGPQSQRAQR